MRVLLSAYACEPNKGSEPEIGWQRALHMSAFAEEVWVLTRSNNREAIEADPLSRAPGLHFIYYDLPKWAINLKSQAWFRRIYFVLWQWRAYRFAAKLHRASSFDRVYHVTFGSVQSSSFMGRLGIPFVIGPIAGGERAPLRLRRGMPLWCKVKELLRDCWIVFQRFNPLTYSAYATATKIYVTTSDSLQLIPRKWHFKTVVQLAVASTGGAVSMGLRHSPDPPRFVFVGRLLYWKGVHLAIRALAEARKTVPSATLVLIGTGPDERHLQIDARRLGVADAVVFAGQISRRSVTDTLSSYTALVFPSLHDSGGLAVLEALAKGLPVICLDLGGPGSMVNASCGIVIPTANASESQIVTRIARAMTSLANKTDAESSKLSSGATARAADLSWTKLTERVIGDAERPA